MHIGARIAGAARPSEVLVSSTVKDIVAGSGIAFEERGEHELAGCRAAGAYSLLPPDRDSAGVAGSGLALVSCG